MAIFAKSDQQTNLPTNLTNISKNTRVKGTISTQCPVQIEGHHEGIINAKETVLIARDGNVQGDISASKLTVSGSFQGVADCIDVQINNAGCVRGKIVSTHLSIDHEGLFEGESIKKENVNNHASVQKEQN